MQQSFDKHVFRILAATTLATIGLGTVVYHIVEKFSWLNAYYFSVVTLTTVGYGDYVPHTNFGKIFTTFYILIGVGIITTFITSLMRRQGARYQQRRHSKDDT
jgi:voltage-gated potassium channel